MSCYPSYVCLLLLLIHREPHIHILFLESMLTFHKYILWFFQSYRARHANPLPIPKSIIQSTNTSTKHTNSNYRQTSRYIQISPTKHKTLVTTSTTFQTRQNTKYQQHNYNYGKKFLLLTCNQLSPPQPSHRSKSQFFPMISHFFLYKIS